MPITRSRPVQLNATNSPSDGQVPSYNSATKKFAWIDAGGSAAGDSIKQTITQANSFSPGQAVRYNGTSWVTAQANSADAAEALGIVESATGSAFDVVTNGKITLASGTPWTAGTTYRLDDQTAGALVSTEPPEGSFFKPMLVALANNVGIVLQMIAVQIQPSVAPSQDGLTTSEVTANVAMNANNKYHMNGSSRLDAGLPASCAQFTRFHVVGKGSGGWKVTQNSGQVIHFGGQDTTTGTSGYIQSTNRYDNILIECTVANTEFTVIYATGTLTVN